MAIRNLKISEPCKKFGAYIRLERIEHRMTVEQLALKMGVHEDWVRGIEAGDFRPDRRMLTNLAWALQVPSVELMAKL